MLAKISRDSASVVFENHTVLDPAILNENCPLSTKSEFWAELEVQNALLDTEIYLLVPDVRVLSQELLEQFKKLKPFSMNNQKQETKSLLRYSNETSINTLYKLDDVKSLIETNPNIMKEINQLVDKQVLKLDKLSTILVVPEDMTYFSSFDGVTLDDLKDFFNLSKQGAAWILNMLEESGVLILETVKMMRFTTNTSLWERLVRSQLKNKAPMPKETDPIELKLLYNKAGSLQQIKDNRKLLNVSKDVISRFCQITEENLEKFYSYLQKENILEPYLYNIWRMNSKMDCSSLPSCIVPHIDEFLADRFAYTFALEEICMSLEKATKHPNSSPTQIFLAENPFRDFQTDLIDNGLVIPSRIIVSSETIDDIDFEDYKYQDKLKSVIHSNRIKLYDQTDFHMELETFSNYVKTQGFLIDSDFNNIRNNGFKLVVTRKKETNGLWLLNKVISIGSYCWGEIKSAANAVGSFCYSIARFAVNLPGYNNIPNINMIIFINFLFNINIIQKESLSVRIGQLQKETFVREGLKM